MKTSIRIWLGLMSAAMTAVPIAVSAGIQHTVELFNMAVTVTQDTIGDNGVYSHVRHSDLYNTGNPGEPSLPVMHLTFSVPYDAYNISVSSTGMGARTIALQSPVYPAQEPRVISDTTAVGFTMPDSGIYNGTGIFPATIAEVVDEGFLEGDNHLVTVAVYPVRYKVGNNTLLAYSSVSLTLSYNSGEGTDSLTIKPLLRYSDTGRAESVEMVKRTVANPAQVDGFLAPIAMRPYTTDTIKGYEYCIVTSRELAPAFRRLVALKRQKGYNAGIVCMEDILANPAFRNGDEVSGINDDAGKLRAYLTYAWKNHSTRFVLLGGKPPHVPIRYGYTDTSEPEVNDIVPTDLYFGDFNGNWNYDNDNLYGEKGDVVDYSPEIYIGRLLCKNREEVNNYIDKLLIYELDPGNGDYSYLKRGFYAQSERMLDNNEAGIVASAASFFCPDYTIINEDGISYPTGAEVIAEMNAKKSAFISIHAHGSPGGVTTLDRDKNIGRDFGINAIDNDTSSWCLVPEVGNGLDCLTNKYYPSIQYSISCTTMPYDIYTDQWNQTFDISLNFGESFTLGKDYGGIAYLGNTRHGYVDSSMRLECKFLKYLKEGNYNIGIAEAFSKMAYYSHHLCLTHNLLGDPEFEIWTDIPVKYGEAEIEVQRYGDDTAVAENIVDSCKIVVCTPDGEIHQRVTGVSGWHNFPGVSPNSAVMIYHHNMIPYIAPLIVQNQTYTKSQYLLASTVQMGKYVNEFCDYGNVVFDAGVDFVVDASGDVYLRKGVIVNPGATVTVKSSGTVTLDGIIVKSGGTLTVEAAETEITSSFEAQDGAMFEIKLLSD